MAIIGIAGHTYWVEDLEKCCKFYVDFGLTLTQKSDMYAEFTLAGGAKVTLIRDASRASDGLKVARNQSVETVFGVDDQRSLDALVADLGKDRAMKLGVDNVYRFHSDCGIALGLTVFEKKPIVLSPDPVNAPDNVKRLGQWRKWRARALPKIINHVVYGVDDYKASWDFFRFRLDFRLSDHSRGLGVFLRADGANEHHNLFLANCHYRGRTEGTGLQHICFGVEDIDELMTGANHMSRLGATSELGIGRHRIASALFYYMNCPTGGEAEYGADSDYLDDGWIPREWEPAYGYILWAANLPPYMKTMPGPDVRILASEDDVDLGR